MSPVPADFACQVINLERSPQRLARIAADLAQAGIAFERFAAVEGRDLDPLQCPDFDRQGYERLHGKLPTANELGCYFSHVGAIRAFLATGREWGLILEDDARVPADLREVVTRLLASGAQGDMNLLYGNRRHFAMVTAELGQGQQLVGYWAKQTGAVAYLINRKAAQAFSQHLLPMRLPLDHAFVEVWRLGIRLRGVHPFVVSTGEFVSDIGRTGTKFAWHRRLRTFGHRLLSGLQRLGYQLVRDPIWWEALRRRRP